MAKIFVKYFRRAFFPAIIVFMWILPAMSHGMDGDRVSSTPTHDSDTVFSAKIYFKKGSDSIIPSFRGNISRIDTINNVLADIGQTRIIRMEIVGSASPEGKEGYNRRLATRRGKALAATLTPLPEVKPDISSVISHETRPSLWPESRYASVRVTLRPSMTAGMTDVYPDTATVTASPVAVKEENDTCRSNAEVVSAIPSRAMEHAAHISGSDDRDAKPGLPFFVNTNLLYDLALTPNIGIGVYLGKHITIYADWLYAWWSNHARRRYWHVWGGDAEVRYGLGHGSSRNVFSGHYIALYASMARYDIQFGADRTGILTDTFNYAAGISYGYSLPLGRRVNLDFSIGVGYAWGSYKKHHKVDDHDVWISTHNRSWLGPTKAAIALTWLLGNGNINTRKGGGTP